jgi:twitching motility two-component system response regulator PilG
MGSMDLLQQATFAAKAGNKAEARRLLVQLTQSEPNHETAWLWLFAIADSPEEALFCLEKVLEINPSNDQAQSHLKGTLLQVGVKACQAGDKEQGRTLLGRVLDLDPVNEQASLWLAAIADAPEEALRHLQRVLETNPQNERALSGVHYYSSLLFRPKPRTETGWTCPLCAAQQPESHEQCPSCKAILHLRDPELFLVNPGLDTPRLKEAIVRFDYLLGHPQPEMDEFSLHWHLALAHLNLKQFEESVTHLRVAVGVGKETQELRQQLDELLRHRDAFETGLPSSKLDSAIVKTPWQSLTILIVETQPSIRKLVSLTMKRSGFKVMEAADGYEMAQILQGGIQPDLVFLQYEVPGANGYQLCQMLRNQPQMHDVPVVLMAMKDGFLHRLRGRWAGCTDFLTKPFDVEELLAMVRKHCEAKLFPEGKPTTSSSNQQLS